MGGRHDHARGGPAICPRGQVGRVGLAGHADAPTQGRASAVRGRSRAGRLPVGSRAIGTARAAIDRCSCASRRAAGSRCGSARSGRRTGILTGVTAYTDRVVWAVGLSRRPGWPAAVGHPLRRVRLGRGEPAARGRLGRSAHGCRRRPWRRDLGGRLGEPAGSTAPLRGASPERPLAGPSTCPCGARPRASSHRSPSDRTAGYGRWATASRAGATCRSWSAGAGVAGGRSTSPWAARPSPCCAPCSSTTGSDPSSRARAGTPTPVTGEASSRGGWPAGWQVTDAPELAGGTELRDLAEAPDGEVLAVGANGGRSLTFGVCPATPGASRWSTTGRRDERSQPAIQVPCACDPHGLAGIVAVREPCPFPGREPASHGGRRACRAAPVATASRARRRRLRRTRSQADQHLWRGARGHRPGRLAGPARRASLGARLAAPQPGWPVHDGQGCLVPGHRPSWLYRGRRQW